MGRLRKTLGVALLTVAGATQVWAQVPTLPDVSAAGASGPIRLRQPVSGGNAASAGGAGLDAAQLLMQQSSGTAQAQPAPASPPPYKPSEFELFVQRRAGVAELGEGADALVVRRLGAELITRADDPDSADYNPQIPPDYLIKTGDEIVVTLWGSSAFRAWARCWWPACATPSCPT
jgi:hypothetical protein